MFQNIGAVLAAIAAAQSRRIFGASNIDRYIRQNSSAGYTQRSRGPATKPKKHRNMVTVSKRVRAKHRRAARG